MIQRLFFIKAFGLLALLLVAYGAAAQQRKYQGVARESDGTTLPGVNVVIKSTRTGVVTDLNGRFSITANQGATLVFSYLGYETQEVVLGDNTELNVIMDLQANTLEELVVVGYGYQKKSDLTAAISSVKSQDIVKTSIASIDQGLQGRASGVVVLNTSGQPGAGTSIRIRGTTSIMGTNEPLYVIDGIPMISGGTSSGAVSTPPINPMSTINPNDVESMEILKDASATAIYGARGANGVILVTTKRGGKGKVRTSFSGYYGIQQITRTMDMLNAVQLAELGNEATDNANMERRDIFANLNNLRKQSTDWQDEIFRLAPIQNYELGFSGGSDRTTYFLSGNYFSQDGIIIGSDYKKGGMRFNLDQEINKRIKIGTSMNLSYSYSHGVVTNTEAAFASSITSWALEMNPGLPVRYPDGRYVFENNTSKPAVGNPVQDANENLQINKFARVLGNVYADFKLAEGLIFKASMGIDYFTVKDQGFTPNNIKRGESNNGFASIGTAEGYTWISENTLSYSKDFGKHNISAVAGITAQQYVSENVWVATSDFEDGRLGFHSIQSGAKKQLASTGYSGWQMASYLARVNYGYDNRYLLTLTGRIDGSSKFGVNERYGVFPSAALAWKIHEEQFMKDISQLSNLKLRASYGIAGNEGIAPYSRQGLLWPTEAYVGTNKVISGQAPLTLHNEDLKWETTAQFNLGLDMGFYHNRYSLTLDYYLKQTSDLLLPVPVLNHSGYDVAMQNVGNLENKGYEVAFNGVPVTNSLFTWETNATFAYNANKVTNLVGSRDGLAGYPVMGISYWTKITEGMPIGTIYGYKTDGIAQPGENLSTTPYFPGKTLHYGDRKYVDRNGDNVLNEEDLFDLGHANPDYTYGWNNSFTLNLGNRGGSVVLSLYLQGVYGNTIANFNKFALESFDGNRNNSTAALKRWTPTNPTNDYPRANASPISNMFSDHQAEDGSYLRVKDITLAYNLPDRWFKTVAGTTVQVYASAKNLHVFTNYSGYDPEVSRFGANSLSMGADNGTYPITRMFIFGVKASF